ncbi:MAG: NAD-dependent epimerase/dehydratase family protein [bacterium]|nr:NAD-dependent epimerase/dehydratase family protein [bacterium]
MKKTFITGGSGFLGRNIKEIIKRSGGKIVVYDRNIPSEKEKDVTYVQGDICDLEKMRKAIKGCDVFFHIAAIADIDEANSKPVETMEVNVAGTAKCLLAAKEAGVKRFVFASSAYAAGNLGSFYRVSKLAGEHLCKTFSKEYNLPFTIVRYGSLYGRYATGSNFIHRLCEEALKSGSFRHYGTGEEIREYIHVKDAARETVNIAETKEYKNKTLLITGHQRVCVKDIFDILSEILGKKIKINYHNQKGNLHYKSTPWSFESEVPVRINMRDYIDISEGIHLCLRDAHDHLKKEEVQN